MIGTQDVNWIYNIKEHNFKVYSQNGEEGYIEYILSNIGKFNNFCVEFGAGDGYHLSNSRYFIDKGYASILLDNEYKGNDDVRLHTIIRENIIALLKTYNCPKEFDFLSIDMDGNDYWVLERILTHFSPRLIIAEYNPQTSYSGNAVAIKYNSEFYWGGDDYYGFTFEAGVKLAEKNGYKVVFQNSNMNMYMVRADLLENLEIPFVKYEKQYYFKENTIGEWEEIF